MPNKTGKNWYSHKVLPLQTEEKVAGVAVLKEEVQVLESRICCVKTAKELVAHRPDLGAQVEGFASSCLISDKSDVGNIRISVRGLPPSPAVTLGISGPTLACPAEPGRSQTSPVANPSWQLQ